jgi:hypothetical protein
MKVSYFETGRYVVPPDLPREWPVPGATYDPEVGAEAYRGMVEQDPGTGDVGAMMQALELFGKKVLLGTREI